MMKISFLLIYVLLFTAWIYIDGAKKIDVEDTSSDPEQYQGKKPLKKQAERPNDDSIVSVELRTKEDGTVALDTDNAGDGKPLRAERLSILQQLQQQLEQLQDLTVEEQRLVQEAKKFIAKEKVKRVVGKTDRTKPPRKQMRPSDLFLEIVECMEKEGITEGILMALHALAPLEKEKQGDPFAHEKIAMIELFEPNAQPRYNFTSALQHLRVAADAGIPSAQVTLALLGLIDFGPAQITAVTVEERREASVRLITTFAKEVEFISSLIHGYRLMTAPRPEMSLSSYRMEESLCTKALFYLHRCAEINVRRLADMGGERPYEMVRLSHEYMAPGSLNEERQIQAAQQFEYYRSVAANPHEEGWAEATQRMGEAYFYGDDDAGVVQDQPHAAELFQQAADGGEPLAMANYGMMLLNGIGVPQDNITAYRYFERGAALGNAFSMHCMGLIYYFGSSVDKNETRAIEWFEQAAEHGYMDSHTFLGSAYLYGNGVEVNETRAFEHFKEAGTTQTSQSYYNLGVMYYRGVGTSPSCEKALGYLRIVATDPSLLSDLPYNLEKAYQAYQQQDYLRAYLHYRLLAELGLEDAHVNAAFLLEKYGNFIYPLTPMVWMGPTKEPLSEAYALYERGTILNDTESMRRIGQCYHDGWDHHVCRQNYTKAMGWYERAAELGDPEAAYNGGVLHLMERDWRGAERFFGMCSTAVFPHNIPCVLASTVLHVRSMVLPRWMT